MKAGRAFGCLFWALLYCVLYLDLVNASSEDDLLDFDFMDAKEGDAIEDWQLADEQQQQQTQQAEKKLEDNMLDFSVDLDEPEPVKQLPPFDWREKVLRTALAKALTDRVLRQRFAEVMPILRVLSSQQRLALSALISAQMNAKQGHELKLEQVRMMFGNDRKLILPIVYDLANLVKNSARKYIQLGSEMAAAALRRKDELTAMESEQDDSVGTIPVSGKHEEPEADEEGLEDFFVEMQAEVLDPQMINEALQPVGNPKTTPSTSSSRVRRSATEFVHKLPRSVPVSVTEQQLLGGAAVRTVKLNTTAFRQPSGAGTQQQTSSTTTTIVTPTQSYEEIENLAFEGLNGTEATSNIDERLYQLSGTNSSVEEPLPNPEELIGGPHYRLNGFNSNKRPNQKIPPIKRKRIQSSSYSRSRPKTSASSHNPVVVSSHKKCERFTNNMCIRTDDYPLEQIMGSIRRHKNAMSALLAEFYDKPNNNLEFGDDFDDYILNKKRREDEGSAGGMCQSVVRYARPQKAKAASGEWKFIVNTGQHTQTLRLEKCSAPGESCSYLAQTYRSHCSQVYNYHRLLSWDKVRGLHVDIFKVPTCCSCQVDGYRQQFPPLSSIQAKEYTPVSNYKDNGNANGYSTINEEDLDYNDESDEDDLGLSYNPYSHRETNELNYQGSKKVRSKLPLPSSVGPYLSPPDDEDQFSSYKNGHKSSSISSSISPSASSKKYYQQLSRRRPQHNEARVDVDASQDLSPSETRSEQEVNVFGPPLAGEQPQQRVPIKRKRIYSSTPTHTATTGGARIPLHVPHQPQTTAATSSSSSVNSLIISSSSLPARTGAAAAAAAAIGGASSPYAHQASAASGATASSEAAFSPGQRISYYSASEKPRPRFYAPFGTTPAAPAPATISASTATPLPTTPYTIQQKQSTPIPQSPHLNSLYSNHNHNNINNNNYNNNHNNGSRRINYSYHPIIDFFENRANSRQDRQEQQEEYVVGASQRVEQRYPAPVHRVASTAATLSNFPHERRMGFGAGGAGSGAGASGGAGRYGYANDNAWQPLVVDH